MSWKTRAIEILGEITDPATGEVRADADEVLACHLKNVFFQGVVCGEEVLEATKDLYDV